MRSGGGSRGRCQQREAGPRRNPPLRTLSYPPTGRGAWRSSQSLKPLEALRSNGTKLSQWAAALQAAGHRSGKSYPCLWLAKVGARSWLAVVPLRPGLHPTEKSARSRPGPGGWGRRTAAEMGPPGAWALVEAEGSSPFVKSTGSHCLSGCGAQIACITMGRGEHFKCGPRSSPWSHYVRNQAVSLR